MPDKDIRAVQAADRHDPPNGGYFWRLEHSHLAAFLALRLPQEASRVFLALADLTHGYGKQRDTISRSQIAGLANVHPWHVHRALMALSELGLYGQIAVNPRRVIRWVVWPPPIESPGQTACTPDGATYNTDTGVTNSSESTPQEVDTKKVKKRSIKKGRKHSSAPSDHKQFIEFFHTEYEKALGRKYIMAPAKEGKLIKDLLKQLSLDELKRAALNMLANPWARDKADIGLLKSKINTWQNRTEQRPASRGTFTPARGSEPKRFGKLSKRFA